MFNLYGQAPFCHFNFFLPPALMNSIRGLHIAQFNDIPFDTCTKVVLVVVP